MESRLRAAAAAVAVTLSLSIPTARAQPEDEGEALDMKPRAHELLVVGLSHFEAKEYEEAIRQFRAGYAIDPRPELLFAIAQAERLSGDCPSAIKAYEMFLDTDPPERQARAATKSIERCRTALGIADEEPDSDLPAHPEPSPHEVRAESKEPDPAPAHTRAPAPDADSLRTPWYRDKVGASLLAAGVVSASVGLGYYVASASDESAAEQAATYDDYADLMDRAERRRNVAWVGLGVGAGLAAGAVVRYWLRDDEPHSGVAVSATGDGAAVVYSTSF